MLRASVAAKATHTTPVATAPSRDLMASTSRLPNSAPSWFPTAAACARAEASAVQASPGWPSASQAWGCPETGGIRARASGGRRAHRSRHRSGRASYRVIWGARRDYDVEPGRPKTLLRRRQQALPVILGGARVQFDGKSDGGFVISELIGFLTRPRPHLREGRRGVRPADRIGRRSLEVPRVHAFYQGHRLVVAGERRCIDIDWPGPRAPR